VRLSPGRGQRFYVWDALAAARAGSRAAGEVFPEVGGPLRTARFRREFSALAEAVTGVERWGRLGLWAEAAARVLIVLRGVEWWQETREWPPPPQPSETPDMVCDVAEVLAGRAAQRGHMVHVGEPYPWREDPTATWRGWVLPALASDQLPAPARQDERLRRELIDLLDALCDVWLTGGPSVAADQGFWDKVEEIGTHGFFMAEGSLLLGEVGEGHQYEAMLRHCAAEVLRAGVGRGMGILRVAQAVRIALQGPAAMLAAAVDPTALEVPLTAAGRWAGELRDAARR